MMRGGDEVSQSGWVTIEAAEAVHNINNITG